MSIQNFLKTCYQIKRPKSLLPNLFSKNYYLPCLNFRSEVIAYGDGKLSVAGTYMKALKIISGVVKESW